MAALLDGLPDRPEPRLATTVGLAFLLGSPIVLLLRQPGTSPLQSLWAEDGPTFLADARHYSLVHSMFRDYGGYLHVPSRLIAEVATLAPIEQAPAVMSGLSAVGAGLVAWFVFRASRYHVESLAVRVLLGLCVVVLPAAGREVLDNVTNLHWFLLYGALWALLTPARNRVDIAVAAAIVLAATTADPVTLVLTPLALARVVQWRRIQWEHLVTGAFVLGSAVQAVAIATSSSPTTTHPQQATKVVQVFGGRVVTAATAGESTTFSLFEHLGWAFVAGATIAVLVGIGLAVRRRDRHARLLVGVLLAMTVGAFLLAVLLRWDDSMVPGLGPPERLGFGERYFVVPQLCLLAAILVLAEPLVSAIRRSSPAVAGAVAVAALVILSWGRDFRTDNARAGAVAWGVALDDAKQSCGDQDPVPVAIVPDGWAVELPCSVLRRMATASGYRIRASPGGRP